jgi:hypothetical protein
VSTRDWRCALRVPSTTLGIDPAKFGWYQRAMLLVDGSNASAEK